MPYSDLCREKILSEDYHDFIVSDIRMPFLQDMLEKDYCLQNPGFFLSMCLPFKICNKTCIAGKLFLFFDSEMLLPAQYAGAKSGRNPSDPEPLHHSIKRKTGYDRISGYRNRLSKSGISTSG